MSTLYAPILKCPRGNTLVLLDQSLIYADRGEAEAVAAGNIAFHPRHSWLLASEWRPTGELLEARDGQLQRSHVRAEYPADVYSGAALDVLIFSGPDFDRAARSQEGAR